MQFFEMSHAELVAKVEQYKSEAEAWKAAALACEDIVQTDEHFEMANDVALSLIEAARKEEARATIKDSLKVHP